MTSTRKRHFPSPAVILTPLLKTPSSHVLRSLLSLCLCADHRCLCALQASIAGNGHLPSHTVLLMGIDAEPREVTVRSVCSMDEDFYRKNCHRPGLCNIQLKVYLLSL